jgi:hypothetical protein
MANWLLLNAQNEIVSCVIHDDTPSEACGINMQGLTAYEVDEFKPLDRYTFDATLGEWTEKLVELKAQAVQSLNNTREQLQLQSLTKGDSKSYIYGRKNREVHLYEEDPSSIANALNFPFAKAQADLTGQTLTEVLLEFQSARDITDQQVAEIEALCRYRIMQVHDAASISEIEGILDQAW